LETTTPSYSATDSASPTGLLVMPATFTAPAVHGILVNLQMGHLGALAGKDLSKVSVRYALDGQEQPPRTFEIIHDTAGGLRPITLDLTDAVPLGGSKTFTVKVTADGLSSYDVQEKQVQRGKPLLITLAFPDSYPKTASKPPSGTGTGGRDEAGQNPGRPNMGGQNAGGHGGGIQPPVAPLVPVPPPIRPLAHGGKPLAASNPGTPSGIGRPPQPIPYHPPIPTTQPQFRPTPIAPLPPAAPPTPDGLVAQPAGPSQINVRWNRVQDATKYVLYRSGGPGQGGGEKHLSGDETSFSDSGLTPGIVYHYRIQSKRGAHTSGLSDPTSALTPPLITVPAKVTLTVSAEDRDIHAVLDFVNVSGQTVYLDKVGACAGHKIGDDVFHILVDGQPLPFTGQKSKRRSDPGPRQFITLSPGKSVRQDVILNHSYRFPSGVHSYKVTYSAAHDFPGRLQSLTLASNEASGVTMR